MVAYVVEQLDDRRRSPRRVIEGMDLMSPFVWKEGELYRMMVRGVPDPLGPKDPTGIICGGASRDGLASMDAGLAITPGPGRRRIGGCEDPTVVVTATAIWSIIPVWMPHAAGLDDPRGGPDLTVAGQGGAGAQGAARRGQHQGSDARPDGVRRLAAVLRICRQRCLADRHGVGSDREGTLDGAARSVRHPRGQLGQLASVDRPDDAGRRAGPGDVLQRRHP